MLADALEVLAAQGADPATGASLPDALRHPMAQRLLVDKVQKTKLSALLQSLPTHGKATVLGAGRPGAAGFLLYPSEAACSLEGPLWATAVRARLHLQRAELAQGDLSAPATSCHNVAVSGSHCPHSLDDEGFHALTCQRGWGVLARLGRPATGQAPRVSPPAKLYRPANQAPSRVRVFFFI